VRVLFASPTYWPAVAFGGPVRMARELTEGLLRRGHSVDVLTTTLEAIDRPPAARWRSETEEVEGVRVRRLATPLRYRWMGVTPTLPFALRRLPRPDVGHIFGFRDPVTTLTAGWCRRHRIPYVFEPLNMVKPQFRNVPLKRGFDRVLGNPVVRGAALVVANSEHERRQLVGLGVESDRVVVRPNGFPPPHRERSEVLRPRLGLDAGTPLVLNVGRWSFKKGLDLLLEAMAELPAAHAALVGFDDGDGTREWLEELRGRLGLRDRVQLLPPFGEEQPRALYAEADVFVLPSRDESFGLVAAEAAAAGVASVVTDQCGVADLLRDRAALVVPVDADSIRQAIERLLDDPALRSRLGEGGRAVAAETSWESVVALQEEYYRRALDG
jgi:glycosyltransferase involved in cell wall biosynthesis